MESGQNYPETYQLSLSGTTRTKATDFSDLCGFLDWFYTIYIYCANVDKKSSVRQIQL